MTWSEARLCRGLWAWELHGGSGVGPLLATVCFSPESMYLSPKGALPARGNQQPLWEPSSSHAAPCFRTEADVWHLPLPSGPHICSGTLSLLLQV